MSDLKERLLHPVGVHEDQLQQWCIEAAAEIDRLEHNQMSTDYANLARVTALQTQEADAAMREANHQQQRAEALDYKCTQFTETTMKAMTLIDELVTENGRLCFFAKEPPNVRLFAAKASWEKAMKKLLGDDGPPSEVTVDTTEVESDTQQEGETK